MKAIPRRSSTGSGKARGRSRFGWANSIRFRLAAWYTAIFAALLVVGGAAFVQTIESGMLSDADFYLARQSTRTTKMLSELTGPPTALDGQLELHGVTVITSRFPGLLWFDTVYSRVVDPASGRVVAESPSLSSHIELSYALSSQLPKLGMIRDPIFVFSEPEQGLRVRICTMTSVVSGHRYILQTAVPWDSEEYRLSGMEAVLAVSIAIVLALGALGGWFLVGRTLRPIGRIVAEAERVNADSLGSELLKAPTETDSEIGRLVETLNRMTGRLHDAFTSQRRYAEAQKRYAEAQRRFAADASHELRTPLTLLRTEIEYALLRPRDAAEYREALENAVSDIDRLCRIVESLMFLARLDIGRIDQSDTGKRVDVDAVARSVVGDARQTAADNGVTLTYACGEVEVEDPPALEVIGEEEQIRLLLRNLIDNAIKYTPSGGSIDITVRSEIDEETRYVTVDVVDNGIGIAEEDIPHVFERFWRSDQARSASDEWNDEDDGGGNLRTAPGTGLGLSIVKQIAIVHGGDVIVSSTLGKGSTFTVRLPAPEKIELGA